MSSIRRFLIASSLARLIARERTAVRIVEGHFPPSRQRLSYVLFEGEECQLVLVMNPGSPDEEEERTSASRRQGEFLLEVCAGSVAYHRSVIEIGGGHHARVDSFIVPSSLHVVEIAFDDADEAGQFEPPEWLGPEVTADPAFEHNALALGGLPPARDVPLTDAALHELINLLDTSSGSRTAAGDEHPSGNVAPFPLPPQPQEQGVAGRRTDRSAISRREIE